LGAKKKLGAPFLGMEAYRITRAFPVRMTNLIAAGQRTYEEVCYTTKSTGNFLLLGV